MKTILIFTLTIVFYIHLLCDSKVHFESPKNEHGEKITCDSVNKIDLLTQDILRKRYLYTFIRGDTSQTKFLLSNYFIISGKSFSGPNNIKIQTLKKDSIKDKDASLISMFDFQANLDTSFVKVKVEYIPLGKKSTTLTMFEYSFDTINCAWQLKDSLLVLY